MIQPETVPVAEQPAKEMEVLEATGVSLPAQAEGGKGLTFKRYFTKKGIHPFLRSNGRAVSPRLLTNGAK